MNKVLLGLGLIVTPFFAVPGLDVRDVKLTAASVCAILLSLACLYSGNIKRINNNWFYILLAYTLTCFIVAPNPKLMILGLNVGNFWVWQPMFNFLIFGLMIIGISSIEFDKKQLYIVFQIMIYCGFVMACYVILQSFNIDQLFDNVGLDKLGKMAGTIGNPTHVSPFIAMLIPLAWSSRRYFFAVVMAISVCLTTSQVAIGAMIIGLVVYFATVNRKWFSVIACSLLLCGALFGLAIHNGQIEKETLRSNISDHQRFETWIQIAKDLNAKPFKDQNARYPFTGWGMGNFKYTFHLAHIKDKTLMRFQQAHNDPAEILYNTGIIGFCLFITALFVFFKQKAIKFWRVGLKSKERALLAGFIIICIAACGTFVWQVGTTAYFSCVFFGLLSNNSVCGIGQILEMKDSGVSYGQI